MCVLSVMCCVMLRGLSLVMRLCVCLCVYVCFMSLDVVCVRCCVVMCDVFCAFVRVIV